MGNLVDVPKAMLAAEGTVRKRTDWDIGMCRGWEALGGHHIIAGAQLDHDRNDLVCRLSCNA
jgi:hypothetical protein